MKRGRAAAIGLCIVLVSATCRGTFGAERATSPTGREPKLVWTAERQAVWNRMVAEDHVWWQRLRSWAEATGTPGERYGDLGQFATFAYQWTGEKRYARTAWEKALPYIETMRPAWNNRNGTRHEFIVWVWMYDWLYPALTEDERVLFIKYLNTLGDLCLDKVEGVSWGTRLGDSDETTGHYFGLAFLDLATGPDNPRAGTFLSTTWGPENSTKPVGGLDSTGANFDTMRNAISYFVEKARGGAWIESVEYNIGTLKLLFIGAEGVKTATGSDHFPEVTALLPEAALEQIHQLMPGALENDQYYQWGDCEHPRTTRTMLRVPLLGLLSGLTEGDTRAGTYVKRLTEDMANSPLANSDRPFPRFFFCYNPYAPEADWRDLPKHYYVAGQGLLYTRDGWDDGASFFGAHMPNRLFVDHEVEFLGDFQLFRKGEWAVTHPIAYGGNQGEGTNSMLIAGLSSSAEVRGALAHEFGPENEYAYFVGATGGQHYRNNYWAPPPTFLHEWTRSILYLPGADRKSDTIVIYDRTNAKDPKTLERWPDRYYPDQRTRIEAAPALKQWIIHMPVEPALSDEAIEWKVPGGQTIRVDTLLPAAQVKTAYDETEVGVPGYIHDSEKKWQVRVWPKDERQWDTFLNVVSAADEGAAVECTLVKSADGTAEGVLIERASHPDVLVVFNATPGGELPQPSGASRANWTESIPATLRAARLRTSPASVTWTAAAEATDVYVMDLDPAKSWKFTVDGKNAPAEVSAAGVARLKVTGAGSHTIALAPGAGGAALTAEQIEKLRSLGYAQ